MDRALLAVLASLCVLCLVGDARLAGSARAAAGGYRRGRRIALFIAGRKTHGYGDHEYAAAGRRIARHVNRNTRTVQVVVCDDGWPKDASLFGRASAVVLASDGGRLVKQHLEELDRLAARGVGIACLHYTLDPGKPEACERIRSWIGGCYEQHWSVNPHWEADFKRLPRHPITRGVSPFKLRDEWYYHMRFVPDMKGVTPLLSAVPPDSTRMRKFGPHSGNPAVRARKGMPEIVAWACIRPGGGRGFGFTGLHSHWNFAHDGFRTLLLNAVVWVAGAEVPPGGVPSKRPTFEELEADIQRSRPGRFNEQAVRRRIEEMNRP